MELISRHMTDEPRGGLGQYRRFFQPHEDALLRRLVEQLGTGDWRRIAHQMPDRSARQCRERYQTYLSPTVNMAPWTESEDRLLLEKFEELGSKWVDYRPFFKERTLNNIKNRWNTITRRNRLEAEYRAMKPTAQTAPDIDPESIFDIENLLKPSSC